MKKTAKDANVAARKKLIKLSNTMKNQSHERTINIIIVLSFFNIFFSLLLLSPKGNIYPDNDNKIILESLPVFMSFFILSIAECIFFEKHKKIKIINYSNLLILSITTCLILIHLFYYNDKEYYWLMSYGVFFISYTILYTRNRFLYNNQRNNIN